MLAARARCAEGVDAQIGGVELDFFEFVRFGHHGNGAGGCVDAPLAFGRRHALHAVAARFKFEFAVCAQPDQSHDHFFIAAQIAFVGGDDFGLPAVALGIAAVHAQQIARKQRGFVAAGTGADFYEYVFVVVGIFGQQQFLQFKIQPFNGFFGSLNFFGGKIFHFGVGQHFLRVGQIALRLGVGVVGFHHGGELGVLLVETAVVVHVCGGFGRAQERGYFFQALGQGLQFA